jgi:ribonucleoside-diphosphate reductase alpha chain
MTRRVRTGEGNLYITINEDDKGLCEVFTTIGKAGGLASTQAEAISRLISLALRSNVDPGAVVKQLKGISGPNPIWESSRLILSTPDAIGQALDDYLNKRPWGRPLLSSDTQAENADRPAPSSYENPSAEQAGTGFATDEAASRTMTTCPHCGGNVIHEAGCITCPSCGYSRC